MGDEFLTSPSFFDSKNNWTTNLRLFYLTYYLRNTSESTELATKRRRVKKQWRGLDQNNKPGGWRSEPNPVLRASTLTLIARSLIAWIAMDQFVRYASRRSWLNLCAPIVSSRAAQKARPPSGREGNLEGHS